MDNIAEGFERGGNKEFINFLGISRGSWAENNLSTFKP
jgi:four helix bundle protein